MPWVIKRHAHGIVKLLCLIVFIPMSKYPLAHFFMRTNIFRKAVAYHPFYFLTCHYNHSTIVMHKFVDKMQHLISFMAIKLSVVG